MKSVDAGKNMGFTHPLGTGPVLSTGDEGGDDFFKYCSIVFYAGNSFSLAELLRRCGCQVKGAGKVLTVKSVEIQAAVGESADTLASLPAGTLDNCDDLVEGNGKNIVGSPNGKGLWVEQDCLLDEF